MVMAFEKTVVFIRHRLAEYWLATSMLFQYYRV